MFLDDDAIPHPGWLDALVDALDRDDVVGAGGPVIPRWATAKPPWFPEEFLWVVGCSYCGSPEERGPIRNPIGANMSFRRSACLDVGGFAVRLGRVGSTPLGCEETELAIRVRASRPDTAILHVPSARVEHLVTAERVRFRYFSTRCWGDRSVQGAGDDVRRERCGPRERATLRRTNAVARRQASTPRRDAR